MTDILVRQIEGAWVRWAGVNDNLPTWSTVGVVHREDGTTEEIEVPPYQVWHTLSAHLLGSWSEGELWAYRLKRAVPFEVPDDKVLAGVERFEEDEDGAVHQIFDVADPPPPTADDVNAERDGRIAAGFLFGGKLYQSGIEDQKRIAGAGTLALGAIVAGAQPGDYRWHGGETDFGWIAADNSVVAMDAQTVFAFGQAAAAWESAHVFAARALKETSPIPADYADDAYWPA